MVEVVNVRSSPAYRPTQTGDSAWRRLYIPMITLIAFSYPITIIALVSLGLPTGEFNQYIKIFLSGLAAASLFLALPESKAMSGALLPLLTFLFLYGLRLIYDVSGLGLVFGSQSASYVYGYFFGLTLLPVIALNVAYKRIDIDSLFRWAFAVIVLTNIALFLFSLTSEGLAANSAFSSRAEIVGEEYQTAVLNPLNFGVMGAMMSALALGVLTTAQRLSIPLLGGCCLLIVIGIANILFSGSRGPFLAFAVALLAILWSTFGSRLRIRQIIWVVVGLIIAGLIYLALFSKVQIFLFDRFLMMFENRTGGMLEERDFLLEVAWQDFLSSPILGSSYVISVGNASPHNIVVEALMSTGLLGGVFFGFAAVRFAIALYRMLRGDFGRSAYCLAPPILCMLTIGLTSYSIGQSPELWIYIALVTVMGSTQQTVARRSAPSFRLRDGALV